MDGCFLILCFMAAAAAVIWIMAMFAIGWFLLITVPLAIINFVFGK